MAEDLPSICKALDSFPRTEKRKERRMRGSEEGKKGEGVGREKEERNEGNFLSFTWSLSSKRQGSNSTCNNEVVLKSSVPKAGLGLESNTCKAFCLVPKFHSLL